MKVAKRVPPTAFQGENFMTPKRLRYYSGIIGGGRTAYVELSRGTGMSGEPIFGVTVRTPEGSRLDPDPSCLKHSEAAAVQYIYDLGQDSK